MRDSEEGIAVHRMLGDPVTCWNPLPRSSDSSFPWVYVVDSTKGASTQLWWPTITPTQCVEPAASGTYLGAFWPPTTAVIWEDETSDASSAFEARFLTWLNKVLAENLLRFVRFDTQEDPGTAEGSFKSAFWQADEEYFEDGMESNFSRELSRLVSRYRREAEGILARIFSDPTTSPAVWAEALSWIGRTKSALTTSSRLTLLQQGLTSQHPLVRDSAALGIASMGGSSAVPSLERAIECEKVPELRLDMLQVLDQLRSSTQCPAY